MHGDQFFYLITFIMGLLLLFRGKSLFFIFPSLIGALWFVAVQDQLIQSAQPRFYLISFVVAFSAITVGYFVFKKVFLKVLVFFGGIYLGFVFSVMFGIQDVMTELIVGVVLGFILLFLFMKLFDLALVIISSAMGSVVVFMVGKEMWNLPEILVPGMFAAGVGFQLLVDGKKKKSGSSDNKSKDRDHEND